ncbi:hypothetical protein JD292_00430 [Leucobacter sp. CSA2]|uniref:Uncharacterized protein n=1 Tax=Leucobacter edaphi TaxID=2796472 RepID=A0A934Q9S9_9MICO|nr:hypothetical protein [Leucobacter edaphi]MBK0420551.1 hypothetical protein [Leucobacter edaphi]
MTSQRRPTRIILFVVLAIAIIALVVAAVIAIPILTHQSAGGSGQNVPTEIVSSASAKGADERTRTLEAVDSDGKPADLAAIAPGERITVKGTGFDAGIGIYLAFCAIPGSPDEKPGPCLGGIPKGATDGTVDKSALTSAWITSDWAWRAFATHSFERDGAFSVTLTVPEATGDGLDCRVTRCAISTRADHTATKDRVQDMLLPVAFAKE